MATSQLTCCTCPRPPGFDHETDDPLPKYLHKCGCPTVSIVCESSSKTATLCGFKEFNHFAGSYPPSIPPIRYLIATNSGSRRYVRCPDCNPVEIRGGEVSSNGQRTWTFDGEDCITPLRTVISNRESENFPRCGDIITTNIEVDFVGHVTSRTTRGDYPAVFGADCAGGAEGTQGGGTYSCVLSSPDSEDDAFARTAATAGTRCSSINELRTTSFSKTIRTSKYTATARNLVVGVTYTGCIRLRRYKAYSGFPPPGEDTRWEEIEPDIIAAFTATASSEEVATEQELPNEVGYAYELVNGGAHIWPTYADCDCPTSYVAPE